MTDIAETLERYAKMVMPNYPNDLCSEAAAEIRRQRAAAQGAWQSIETAPQDGTPILLGFPGNAHALVGHWEWPLWGEFTRDFGFDPFEIQPTHWMYLPAAPGSLSPTQRNEDQS
jgi:hypothetical protein